MRARHRSLIALVLAACGGRGDAPEAEATAPPPSSSASASVAALGSASGGTTTTADAAAAPVSSSTPLVALDGATRAPLPVPSEGPRLAARGISVPVRDQPEPEAKIVGWLRAGAIVARSAEPAGKAGCKGGWYSIDPAGYVCVDEKATLDLDDPIVRASSRRPDRSQKLPYMYGTVTRGGPVYGRIPTAEDLSKFEPSLRGHIDKWRRDEVSGAGYGLDVWFKWKEPPSYGAWEAWEEKLSDPELPWFLRDHAFVPDLSGAVKKAEGSAKIGQVDRRQGAAFVDSVLVEGRRYNVTTDLRVVPADRYRPIRGSDYVGVRIGVDVKMPFALVRRPGGKKWTLPAKGKRVEAGELPWRAALQLTGKQKFADGLLHYELEDGSWVDDRHASRIDPAKKMPKWGKNGEKWLDVNITKQVLVAYDGETPVYATLVSTGESGLDDEGGRSTKKGIFRIHTKHVSATMDSDVVGEEFELRDVPYVQYFEGGYALHAAYWHDSFGRPKSHGCINLSPEDARRLFHFTEPSVPDHWHGAARALTGTVIFVHP